MLNYKSDLVEMNIPKQHCKMILRQVHNFSIKYHPILNQKQLYSNTVIPTIDKILSHSCVCDCEYDESINTSCGFPDIESSYIDINKIHNKNYNIQHSCDSTPKFDDDFHSFPHTFTNTSPSPLNVNIKNNNKALK